MQSDDDEKLRPYVLERISSRDLVVKSRRLASVVFGVLFILVGVISVLVYFYFSVEHTGVVGKVSRLGIWVLMISFGAAFGYTVMARVSLLTGRFQFLGEWLADIPLVGPALARIFG